MKNYSLHKKDKVLQHLENTFLFIFVTTTIFYSLLLATI